jgi:hypothetical protein
MDFPEPVKKVPRSGTADLSLLHDRLKSLEECHDDKTLISTNKSPRIIGFDHQLPAKASRIRSSTGKWRPANGGGVEGLSSGAIGEAEFLLRK